MNAACIRNLALALLLALLAACRTPVGTDHVSMRQAQRQIDKSVLNLGVPSSDTLRILHRYDLEKLFARDRFAAIDELHRRTARDDRRDQIFALAELSYLHADELSAAVKPGAWRAAPDFYLASAIYSWLYLFGDGPEPRPGPFDRRFRIACDLYSRATALAFMNPRATNAGLVLRAGERHVGHGSVMVELNTNAFPWRLDEFEQFIPADSLKVRGLSVRDRSAGIGAPLVALQKTRDLSRGPARVPATLLLRVKGGVRALQAGRVTATVELYSGYDETEVQIGDQKVPLQVDITAPVADGLNNAQLWRLGRVQFFHSEQVIKTGVYPTQPYEPGRIPVVFVHGTFSSPVWWAEMFNTLRADPELRKRCQFWYFIYNSGNPLPYSANKLREALTEEVNRLDPEGKDPALRQMVVIGHSQGGLLTKGTVTNPGDKLWRIASDKKFEDLDLPEKEREALRRMFFYEPLPFVTRVVFVSTPHRGSYRSTSFVRRLASRVMSLPNQVLNTSVSLLQNTNTVRLPHLVKIAAPTSLDGMSPKNPFLLALADIPVATNVTAHSIVAIKGDDRPPAGGDGVVKYTSAHIEYAKSELVVRSGHSCQAQPATIEEVRRILHEHLK